MQTAFKTLLIDCDEWLQYCWHTLIITVKSWLTSYLSSRSFVVSINYFLCNFSPSSRYSTRISPWTTLIHTPYYSSLVLSLIRLSAIIYLLMTLNCSSPSGHLNYPAIFYTYKIQLISSLNGCHSANLLTFNQSKTAFLLIGLPT